MTYITYLENNGAGIGHNSFNINMLIYLVNNKPNLKYYHTNFMKKSKYYDIIFQYEKFNNHKKVNKENLIKRDITKLEDFDLDDDNILLIVEESILRSYFKVFKKENYFNEINNLLISNINNIREFLKNDIDYDNFCINITLHLRRGDIMMNNGYLNGHKSRYLPNSYYKSVLNKIRNLNLGKLKINLISEGIKSDFEDDFKDYDINYILGKDSNSEELKKQTIAYLIFNDILVIAPSGLSDICSIYSTGMIIDHNVPGLLKNPYLKKDKILDIENMNKNDILNKINKILT